MALISSEFRCTVLIGILFFYFMFRKYKAFCKVSALMSSQLKLIILFALYILFLQTCALFC